MLYEITINVNITQLNFFLLEEKRTFHISLLIYIKGSKMNTPSVYEEHIDVEQEKHRSLHNDIDNVELQNMVIYCSTNSVEMDGKEDLKSTGVNLKDVERCDKGYKVVSSFLLDSSNTFNVHPNDSTARDSTLAAVCQKDLKINTDENFSQQNDFHLPPSNEKYNNENYMTKQNCLDKLVALKDQNHSFGLNQMKSMFAQNPNVVEMKNNSYENNLIQENSQRLNFKEQQHQRHTEQKQNVVNENDNIISEGDCQMNNFFESTESAMDIEIGRGGDNNNKDAENSTLFPSSRIDDTNVNNSENSTDTNNAAREQVNFDFPNHPTNVSLLTYGVNNQPKISTFPLWNPQPDYKYNKPTNSISKGGEHLPKLYPVPFQSYYKELDVNSDNKHFISNCEKSHKYVDLRHFYLHQHGSFEMSNQFTHENPTAYTDISNAGPNTNHSTSNSDLTNLEHIDQKSMYSNIVENYNSGNEYYKSNNMEDVTMSEINESKVYDGKFFKENITGSVFMSYNSSSPSHLLDPAKITCNSKCIGEDFGDDTHSKLKVLSPSTKHENQDDGYETSAGDVLTPNSYSSSNGNTPNLQSVSHISNKIKTEEIVNKSLTRKMEESRTISNSLSSRHFGESKHMSNQQDIQTGDGAIELEPCQISEVNGNNVQLHTQQIDFVEVTLEKPMQKRRGRKKKVIDPNEIRRSDIASVLPVSMESSIKKDRKKHDRFNGLAEEEVVKRLVPDHIKNDLDILIVGLNPGLFAAYKGHHYAGPGNHFWKCLFLSGLIPEQMSAEEDFKLVNYGIGFTNLVSRPTKGSADLTRKEIKEGSEILLGKLKNFKPKIVVFNGKFIFEVFSGRKEFNFGKQPEYIDGTTTFVWVMPSSSARCAQLPRAADKIPFYAALKKFRDYLNGIVPTIDDKECIFTEEKIKEMCCLEKCRTESIANTISSSTNDNLNKKKRGRPKKIKNEHCLTAPGGNINVSSSKIEMDNVLNLSLMKESQQSVKKKRGRPKKIRDISGTNVLGCHTVVTNSICSNKFSDQDAVNNSPHFHSNAQNSMYAAVTPIASPMVNCSYVAPTPPLYTKPSTPMYQNANKNDSIDEISLKTFNECGNDKNVPAAFHQISRLTSVSTPHLGESPPPSSPNICTDFDPPSSNILQVNDNGLHQNRDISINSEPRFSVSGSECVVLVNGKISPNYQNWMTAQNDVTGLHNTFVSGQPPVSFHQSANFSENRDWQRKRIFHDTTTTSYCDQISNNNNRSQPKQQMSDMTRKSLSSLESLVDQIPSAMESESISCQSSTTVISNSPQGTSSSGLFQNSPNGRKSIEPNQENLRKCYTNHNRFSVSNLVNINEKRHPYPPHNDIMAAAALAAVVVNPNNSSTHHVQHGPIYMDQHIPHVAPGSLYGSGPHASHHHGVSHHHPASYGQSHVDYGTPYTIPGQLNTIHMPSPNYPYSFGGSSGQSTYSNYIHPVHHTQTHPASHLSMYERLKTSNIGNYGGF